MLGGKRSVTMAYMISKFIFKHEYNSGVFQLIKISNSWVGNVFINQMRQLKHIAK